MRIEGTSISASGTSSRRGAVAAALKFGWVLMLFLTWTATAASPPGEPEVTADEAAVLRRSAALAETDPVAAIRVLHKTIYPEANAALLFALGGLYAQTRQFHLAESAYRQALARQPGFLRARQNLGAVLVESHQYAAAVPELQALLQAAPERTTVRLTLAGVYLERQDPEAAAKQAQTVLAKEPNNPKAKILLARARVAQGNEDDAAKLLRGVLASQPDDRVSRRWLCDILMRSKRYPEAITELRQLLSDAPDAPDARRNLVSALLATGAAGAAAEELQRLVAAAPADTELRLQLARCLVQADRRKDAIAELRSLREKAPADVPALALLGALQEEAGDADAAVATYRLLLAHAPERGDSRWRLAGLLMAGHAWEEAAGQLTMLLEGAKIPDQSAVWEALGHCHRAAGRLAAAEAAYRHALALRPGADASRQGLLSVLMEAGETDAARALLKDSLRRDPQRSDLWQLLAEVELSVEHRQAAITALETARRLGVADAPSRLLLGQLLLDERVPDAALQPLLDAAADATVAATPLLDAAELMLVLAGPEKTAPLLDALGRREPNVSGDHATRLATLQARSTAAQGDTEAAISSYRKLLAKSPDQPWLLIELGDLLRAEGTLDEALLCYERAARADAGCEATSLVKQAQIAVARRAYSRAVRLLEKAQRLAPRPELTPFIRDLRGLSQ